MKNKQKQQDGVLKKTLDYECNICGERHPLYKICPIIDGKITRYRSQKKKNLLYGNILLECIKKDINIYDLMYEVCYLTEILTHRDIDSVNFNMEMVLDYIAMELNCSPKMFVRAPEKTLEELMEWLEGNSWNFENVSRTDKGKINLISFKIDVDNLFPESEYSRWNDQVGVYAVKERAEKNKWVYRLYLDTEIIYMNGMDQRSHPYVFTQLESWGKELIIAEDYCGKLSKEIEHAIDMNWEKMADKTSADDTRFNIWVKKVEEATRLNQLVWVKCGNSYYTKYEEYDIRLNMNQRSYSPEEDYCTVEEALAVLLQQRNYSPKDEEDHLYHQFSVRIDEEHAFTFILSNDDSKKGRLYELSQQIVASIDRMETLVNNTELEEKRIGFSDVMVVSSSMYCKTKGHNVVPCRGIVNIITENNTEEEYYIYVGYCKECKTYTVFSSDYNKMLEKGRPLCVVYNYREAPVGRIHSEFKYKSQSVLAVKGYNVQANSDLSELERQKIIKDCLDNKLVQVHDVLDFLNWLIRTREPLQKYKHAISKWKKDIEFVESYREEERRTVIIDSITLK